MIQREGVYFPDKLEWSEKWRYSFTHVNAVEWAIAHCPQRRTAVQAGGNIGLWPRRLAEMFDRVITFEPDALSHECLIANVAHAVNVDIRPMALGHAPGRCGIKHHSVGKHCVIEGSDVEIITIDSLGLTDLDFLQLDIEGYEWHALTGAAETIRRCRPLVQVELRNHTKRYGLRDADVIGLLKSHGYREVSKQQGSDVVFQWRGQ